MSATTSSNKAMTAPPLAVVRRETATKRLPLYLLGGASRHVDLDGPALRLRQSRATDLRYPLARLSRILAGQTIQWSSKALCACMEARIPIIFLGKGKEPLGYVLPAQPRPSRLDDAIQEYVSLDQWRPGYQNWLRAERMRALREWYTQRALHGHEVSESEYRELVRAHIYQGTACLAPVPPMYHSAITALVAETLVRSGVSARYQTNGGEALELLQDITSFMDLVLRLEIHGMGDRVYGTDAALLSILHMFAEALQGRCLGILRRLHKTLSERLEQWH